MFASMIPHRYLYQSLAFPLTREQDPQMFRLVPRPESALRQPFPAEQHGLRFGGANSHHFFVQSCSNMTAQKLGLLRAVSPTPEKEPPTVIPRHHPSTKRAKDCIPGNRSQSQTHPSGCHTEKCDWSLLHGSTVQWWRVSTTTCMQRFALCRGT